MVFVQVDAHNIVPCWVASEKQEVGARTLRPKIHKKISKYLTGLWRGMRKRFNFLLLELLFFKNINYRLAEFYKLQPYEHGIDTKAATDWKAADARCALKFSCKERKKQKGKRMAWKGVLMNVGEVFLFYKMVIVIITTTII